MKSIQVPLESCPVCSKKLDALSGFNDETPEPKPNDLTLCIECATILVFKDDMKLRQLTQDEFNGLPFQQQVQIGRVRAAIRETQKQSARNQ